MVGDRLGILVVGQGTGKELVEDYSMAMDRFSYNGEYTLVRMVLVVRAILDTMAAQVDLSTQVDRVDQEDLDIPAHQGIQVDRAYRADQHNNLECTQVRKTVDRGQRRLELEELSVVERNNLRYTLGNTRMGILHHNSSFFHLLK